MKIICISGKARHGKDTAAEFFSENLKKNGRKVIIAHYADLLKYICKTWFDWDGQKDEKGRGILQYVGTDVIRKVNPDYWVDFIVSILKMFSEWDYVIIPDCRFPNEIERLKKEGFDVYSVRITRPDFDSGLTDEQLKHISEIALDNYEFDSVLINYTLEELKSAVEHLIKDIERDL